MNTFNKNVGRTICIFLLLTLLYVGLCSGRAPEFSQDVVMVGDKFPVNGNYSILVAGTDIKEKNAQFVLYDKEEKVINVWTVSEGEFFILKDGETFYYSAILESVVTSDNTIKVQLTDINSGYYSSAVEDSSPIGNTSAVVYSPTVVYSPAVGWSGSDSEYIMSFYERLTVILFVLYAFVILITPPILLFLILYYRKRYKKKFLELDEETALLAAESHSMRDRFNNVEIELERIGEFMDMQPRENPYIAGGAVDDTGFWIGNENLINRVMSSIGGNHFFIRGERRAGKTTLLRRIVKALEMRQDPETRFIPVYVSLQGIPHQMFFQSLYNAIVSKVNINPSEFEEIVDVEDFINALSYIIESLNNSSSTKSIIVLVLDEFELFNSYPIDLRESFRTVFMGDPEFSAHIKLIAAGTELTMWTRSSPMNYLIELEIKPLTANEARELILTPATGVASFDETAVDRIIEITHGRPFDVQKICEQLVTNAIQKRVYRIKAEDVEVASDLISPNHEEVLK